MATQLKNIVAFTVGGGATVVHPHLLNVNGYAVKPDFVIPDVGGLTITADATNITAHNPTAVAITANILAEHWHSLERAFGPRAVTDLTPQPLVIEPGSGGGGGGSLSQAFEVAVDHTTNPNGFVVALPVAEPNATWIPEVIAQFPTVNDATQIFVLARANATLTLGALSSFADGTILFITITPKTN